MNQQQKDNLVEVLERDFRQEFEKKAHERAFLTELAILCHDFNVYVSDDDRLVSSRGISVSLSDVEDILDILAEFMGEGT